MYRSFLCAAALTIACHNWALAAPREHPHPELDEMIARYARMHGVPEELVHRIVIRESRYNPALVHRRFYGLMQISYATARSMGYKGTPRGLLDPETNLTYGVPYLANAYKTADGDQNRAVGLYAGGYYYVAKRKKLLGQLRTAASEPLTPAPSPAPEPVQEAPANPVAQLFQFLAGPAPATAAPVAQTAVAQQPAAGEAVTQEPAAQQPAAQQPPAQVQQTAASSQAAPVQK